MGVPPAPAQFMRDHEAEGGVRGFHGPRSVGKITRSFQSDAEADAEFKRILSAVGLGYVADRITLRATSQTPNAEAFIDDKGERFIFYNASFMQRVKERAAEDWSPISILAHEVGHHLAFHTAIEGNDHKFELEADYFSGFVLRRLGATLDQALAAMRVISPTTPGPTHPGLDDRLQVITIGWKDGGASGAPPGLKDAKQSAAGAQKAEQDRKRAEAERQRLALLEQQEQERKRAHDDCAATGGERVIAACTRIIDDPTASPQSHAKAYNYRGYAYGRKKDFIRAIADFNEAIRLDPSYAGAYHNRGVVNYDKKDFDRAIADYSSSIRLDPNAESYFNRGVVYFEKKDFNRAIADYSNAIRLDPTDANAYYSRGGVYHERKDFNRAIADYNNAIRLDPTDANAYYNRGLAYESLGRKSDAIQDYRRALTRNPNDKDSRKALRELLGASE